MQVGDSIGAGSEHFLAEEDKASQAFRSKGQILLKDGMEIKSNRQHLKKEKGNVFAHQKTHIPRNAISFMSHRGQAAYVSICTRPDVACAVNQRSQVKEIEAADPDFKRLDDIFSRLKADDFRFAMAKSILTPLRSMSLQMRHLRPTRTSLPNSDTRSYSSTTRATALS